MNKKVEKNINEKIYNRNEDLCELTRSTKRGILILCYYLI